MDHRDCDGTADHGQEQARDGQRNCHGDGGVDRGNGVGSATVESDDHEDCGGHGRESRVRGNGGADVRPAEGNHLKGAAEDDALLRVAADQTDKGAGNKRLMELELVENAFHTSQESNDNDQKNRKCRHEFPPSFYRGL